MGEKSGGKSGRFTGKEDPRNGKGPAPGAPNAGRPPSEFREAIRAACDRHNLAGILLGIATADIQETYQQGTVVMSATKNTDRIAAAKLLMAYGYGQPQQSVDVTSQGKPVQVVNAPGFAK